MNRIEPFNIRRLREITADQIETLILSGEFKVGELLPSEAKLAEMFHIGRRAVREALLALQAKGLVQTKMGIGTHVVHNELDGFLSSLGTAVSGYLMAGNVELDDIFEFRGLIERYAARRLARAHDEEVLQDLEGEIERQYRAKRDFPHYQTHHFEFHSEIVDYLENPIISFVFGQLLKITLIKMQAKDIDLGAREKAIEEHTKILARIKENPSGEKVAAAVNSHLAANRARL